MSENNKTADNSEPPPKELTFNVNPDMAYLFTSDPQLRGDMGKVILTDPELAANYQKLFVSRIGTQSRDALGSFPNNHFGAVVKPNAPAEPSIEWQAARDHLRHVLQELGNLTRTTPPVPAARTVKHLHQSDFLKNGKPRRRRPTIKNSVRERHYLDRYALLRSMHNDPAPFIGKYEQDGRWLQANNFYLPTITRGQRYQPRHEEPYRFKMHFTGVHPLRRL